MLPSQSINQRKRGIGKSWTKRDLLSISANHQMSTFARAYVYPSFYVLQEKNNQFVVGTKFMLVLISQNILFLSQDAHFRFICSDLRTTPSAVDHLVPKQQKSIMMGNHTARCPSSKLQIALAATQSLLKRQKARHRAQDAKTRGSSNRILRQAE